MSAGLRTAWSIESFVAEQAFGIDWEHEVRVATPPGYEPTDEPRPTLWILDNALEIVLPIVETLTLMREIPELVLVAVGPPPGTDGFEVQRRRTFAFTPAKPAGARNRLYFEGPQGDRLGEVYPAFAEADPRLGGADLFLDFLVDQVRPQVAARFRIDPSRHGIIGISGGGNFVGHALFARPSAFEWYFCGSPTFNINDFRAYELEESYAAEHQDLPVSAYFCAGDGELTEDLISAGGVVSSLARMVETLAVRRYPSLRLVARIFPGAGHGDIWPLITRHGLPALLGTYEGSS